MADPVLEIANLSVAIKGRGDRPHAVRGINLTVGANEIVCVVGESGSGKSVTAQAVMGLLPKNAMQVETGSIRLQGEELTTKSDAELRAIRGTRMAMVFQEPMTALNPVERVGDQIGEVLEVHTDLDPRRAPQARARDHARGASARSRADDRRLSASALRRPAPAHHDRGGAGARSRIADCR